MLVLALSLAVTGCSAAKSAIGVLSPKPQPISVVTYVSAPAVTVAPAPVTAPAPPARRGLMEKVGIVTTATAAGALLGGALGHVVGERTLPSVVVGATVGAAVGAVITTR